MFGVRRWFASIVLVALSVTAGASATISHDAAIDPGQRVGGMLVVQGIESDADLSIWTYCNPIVTAPGTRSPDMFRAAIPTSPDTESGESREGSSMRLGTSERGRCRSTGGASRGERRPAAKKLVLLRLWAIVLVGAKGNSLRDPVQIASGRWRRVHLQHVEVHHLAALAICRFRGEWGARSVATTRSLGVGVPYYPASFNPGENRA